MKKAAIFCLVIIIMFLSACSDTSGYIVRYDITMEEMNYFYEGTELRYKNLTIDNIEKVLGLPHGKYDRGQDEYIYYTEFGVLHFEEYPVKNYLLIYADLLPGVEEPEYFDDKAITIDPNKYKMEKRLDINEDELTFINEETTPPELQEKLGAPHNMTYGLPENIGIGIYIYVLENKNIFKVAYTGYGHIYKAWVEDDKGNELYTLAAYDPEDSEN